ncbi:flagellar protein FliS [Vallitalea okinawensis]|uniref:flagellar protein FliS n=1 Tax=Vallitalea okinawensis TaxID=2078660 RepID=UPI000CFB53E1|nr:flagellar protein FliS [Vallitalea okinawensis]
MSQIKEWTLRISQANQEQLLLITYEILVSAIDELKDYLEKKDLANYKKKVRHTQKILNYLMNTLDMSYEISYDLLSLYLYLHKLLVQASISMDKKVIEGAEKILKIIQKGFIEACELEVDNDSESIMINSQKVYAGLTYGKGALQEVVLDYANRGLEA